MLKKNLPEDRIPEGIIYKKSGLSISASNRRKNQRKTCVPAVKPANANCKSLKFQP